MPREGVVSLLPHGQPASMSLTPVQHPANDMTTDIITTHFDYHSIDHNLLKLDILGHDDPTMIRTLEEYITSDAMDNEYNEENPFIATNIPLDDKKVLSLFHDTSALGIKPEDIDGCNLGCLGIPGVRDRLRYSDGTGCEAAVTFRPDPYIGSVPRDECVAGKCTGTGKIRKGHDFHLYLYT